MSHGTNLCAFASQICVNFRGFKTQWKLGKTWKEFYFLESGIDNGT